MNDFLKIRNSTAFEPSIQTWIFGLYQIFISTHAFMIYEAKQKKMFVCENPGGQKNIHQAGRESIFFA